VKHVYVETNFVVDLLRPLPSKGADSLFARHGVDVTLHVPWCSITEAKRTLDDIVREDLGFIDNAGRFMRQLGPSVAADQAAIARFIQRARQARRDALYDHLDRLEQLANQVNVLQPSKRASQLVVDVFRRKSLKPFDEMVMATVLADAEARNAVDPGPHYFCNLNTKDFEPTTGNELSTAYQSVGLKYLSTFEVP
jgi:hypothetical protein